MLLGNKNPMVTEWLSVDHYPLSFSSGPQGRWLKSQVDT